MDFSDEMIDEIFKIFQVESEEIISKINNSLLTLEKNPNDKDAILMLFRDAHSLKGASRMIGFNDVQTIAHKMEDILGLAKEEKISLNSKIVDVLYKTIDFLSDLIQKSIQKKQQIYSEDISKQIAVLEQITESAENTIPIVIQQDFDKDYFISKIDKINHLLVDSLILLMKIEIKSSGDLIQCLLLKTNDLYNIFVKVGSFDIKKEFENIKVKLEFTAKGSNSLTINETRDIHQTFDNIINKLFAICELYNVEIVDYYSLVFDNMENEQETAKFKVQSVKCEETEQSENKNDIYIPQAVSLDLIKEKFNALLQNTCSIEEIQELIKDYKQSCDNKNIKNILGKILQILNFAVYNEIKLNEEIISVINQALEHSENITKNLSETVDDELISQQLEIVQQLLELNEEKTQIETISSSMAEKGKKLPDFAEIFNTGEIKTLRVDSLKLDELITQVNELTIEKIKTKKHLFELNKINKDIEEWQKNLTKILNYLKYYDKKSLQINITDGSNSFFSKQILTLFSENNKKIQEISSHISHLQRNIQEDDLKLDLTIDNLSTMVKNIRILPFATIFHLFGRMVRDIAQEKNKKIDFEIIGSETCTDKKIIEEIKVPLIHIIRNAIDHGIETPEERIKLSKPPEGKIILSARQANNKVIIEIRDDGRGINLKKIKEKALAKGFLTQEELNSMNNEQITNLIFAPGFSTGDEVTNISGRGIGLDVVQTKIAQLNGKVKVISELNKGCCVQIELPTTMSLLKVFLVKVADQTFAIPMEFINTVLRKSCDEIISKQNNHYIIFENKKINLYSLSEILNLGQKCINTKNKKTILVLESDGKIIAICVDELLGEQEILHKKLSAPFYKLKNISGLTTLISGETCLILNIADILNFTNTYQVNPNLLTSKTQIRNKHFTILLVDDSTTTISLEKNILTKAGYKIETATNPIEALKKMKNTKFDLIISDIEMPEMNGLDFLDKIKTDEMYSDIPVIMVSSLYNEESKGRAMKSGAEKYIIKGEFDQDDFQKTVYDILHNM